MADRAAARLRIALAFPLGIYHAQSSSSFAQPEWPPHPVRVIAALVAAAASLESREAKRARDALALLCSSPSPAIVAPQLSADADGETTVAAVRGASRWAPRNHELGELKKGGVHPRVLERGRAAVEKGGVAIGDLPVTFEWDAALADDALAALRRAAGEVTFVGASRSPVLMTIEQKESADSEPSWRPAGAAHPATVSIRVPTPSLLEVLDDWHERRRAPSRTGALTRARLVPAPTLGRFQDYIHATAGESAATTVVDPEIWGEMLVVVVDSESSVRPKAPATFALARAVRAALLARFGDVGTSDEAPTVLRGRGEEPHAAFVPLPFVDHPRADGRIVGVAVVLPHPRRAPGVLAQRRDVESGLRGLVEAGPDGVRTTVGVPGVGNVLLGRPVAGTRPPLTLHEQRWRRPSRTWSTVTPVVHSRYRRNERPDALLEQVTADCRDAGLPDPEQVEVRRTSRFAGAPSDIARRALPDAWTAPLRGPRDHLELRFPQPVAGPILLGRARHFGLGLCLPVSDGAES